MRRSNALICLLTCSFLIAVSSTVPIRAGVSRQQYETRHSEPSAVSAVQLQPVFSGLTFPVYVTHAHDGTNRLFIIEKVGCIRVEQTGAYSCTVLLVIVG